jgi:hypothetical protein
MSIESVVAPIDKSDIIDIKDEEQSTIGPDGLAKMAGDSTQVKMFENMFTGIMKAAQPQYNHMTDTGPKIITYKGFYEKTQSVRDHLGNQQTTKILIINSKHMLKILQNILQCVQNFFGDTASFSPPSAIMLYYYELIEWEERFRHFMKQNNITEEDLKCETDKEKTEYHKLKESLSGISNRTGGYQRDFDALNHFRKFVDTGHVLKEDTIVAEIPFSFDLVKEEFDDLIKYLQTNYRGSINTFIKMVKAGVIDSSNLGRLLKIGDKYLFEDIDTYNVGVLYCKNFTGYGWYFGYKMIKYDHKKKRFCEIKTHCVIPDFIGTLQIDSMPFKSYNEYDKDTYVKRGAMYCKLVKEISHLSHSGFMYRIVRNQHIALMKLRNNGRIVIDDSNETLLETQQNTYQGSEHNFSEEVPEDKLDLCYPYLYGHSLTNKEWGDFLITDLTNIIYRDDAFDLLRLDTLIDVPTPEGDHVKIMKKELIHKIVLNQKNIKFHDIIDGKSSGLIILLYGPPGVGKTLTAEVTAEVLHLPLRKLSLGELGTSVGDIEKKLTELLDNVRRWNAVLLIDEVDILLEKRSEKTSIKKNAIVGVFLRELEYHDGIIFLTSNRFEVIDPAVDSRIHFKISYDDLSHDDKMSIFRSHMRSLSAEPIADKIETLIEKCPDFNGRKIKNILMMSQCFSYPAQITHAHISAALKITNSY